MVCGTRHDLGVLRVISSTRAALRQGFEVDDLAEAQGAQADGAAGARSSHIPIIVRDES
jgi:hypothetical protein